MMHRRSFRVFTWTEIFLKLPSSTKKLPETSCFVSPWNLCFLLSIACIEFEWRQRQKLIQHFRHGLSRHEHFFVSGYRSFVEFWTRDDGEKFENWKWITSQFNEIPGKSKFASHEKSQACVFYLHFCVSPLKRPNFVQLIFIIYYAAGAALFAARGNKKYENWIKCFWSGSWGWKRGSTWTATRQTMED